MCASRRRTTPARASSTRASATFTGRSLVPTESTSTSSTSYRRARRRTSFRQLHRRNAPRDNNKREERLDEQEADHDDLDDGCARECGGGGDSRSGRRHRGAAAGGRLQHGLRPGLSQPEFEWAGQHDGRECRERQRRRRRQHARHAWPVLAVRVHVLLPTATRSIDRTARDEEGEARECGSFLSEAPLRAPYQRLSRAAARKRLALDAPPRRPALAQAPMCPARTAGVALALPEPPRADECR